MLARRVESLTGIGLDQVAAAAGSDPEVLRLENLDTDIPIPDVALTETRRAAGDDDCNSWLPLTGRFELREAVARRLKAQTGESYDPATQIVITCGGMEGLVNSLLATIDPGRQVVMTDPTYAGMINRVRLVGGDPVLVPFHLVDGEWRLDLDRLQAAITDQVAALFIMNPSMPSGAVLNQAEWEAIASHCRDNDLWLIYNAAMETILYDGRPYFHPASLDGMAARTITVGSASKEYRMIGWKVGWVAGPPVVMEAIGTVHVYNTADPVSLTQTAVAAALDAPEGEAGVAAAVAEWQRRRDVIVHELDDLPLIPAAGGWSMLLDVGELGFDSVSASQKLLSEGKIAATYMRDWGDENSDQFVRLVFSNEPVERLAGIGDRVRTALTG
jgi:aspartate/methionine/tyrosine aminotransferase